MSGIQSSAGWMRERTRCGLFKEHRLTVHASTPTQHRTQRWLCRPSINTEIGQASNSYHRPGNKDGNVPCRGCV